MDQFVSNLYKTAHMGRQKTSLKGIVVDKCHFQFLEVTSGCMTSLPVSLWTLLGVSISLYEVWWQSDNSPAHESQIRVISGCMTSLPVSLLSPLGVSSSLCDSLVAIGQFFCPGELTSCFWRSLPVVWNHFRYCYGVRYLSVLVCAKCSGNRSIPLLGIA